MAWLYLDGCVGLQVEVAEERESYYAFDLRARWTVAMAICILTQNRVETYTMTLDTDDSGDVDVGHFAVFVDVSLFSEPVHYVGECVFDGR